MHAYKPRYIAATVTATFMYFMTIVPLLAEAGTNAGSREKVSTSASTEVSVPGVLSEEAAGAIKSASATRNAPFKALNVIRAILPTVTATSDMAHIEQKLHQEATDPPIIGTGLDIPELNWVGAVKSNFFHLDATAGGSLFGMRILSVGAVGIRLGLLIEHIPAEARFAFFTADSDEAVAPPVNGDEIVKLLALNLAAGDSSNEGRTYWSPVVKGEEVVILVYVPKDIDPNELRFTIPRISHIFKEPLSDKAAGACNLDTTCYSSWSDEAKAVAKMVFTESGDSFLCTGSLLADQDQSSMIPYFLSANHCISTQTVASSLETYWFWQSASCNDSARDSRYSMLTEGAQLLYANSTSDTSFMRLNSQPPVGVSYLGWTTEDPSIGANVTGIHHPHGDRKKISFGDFEGFYPYLGSTPVTNGNHIGIYWTLGTSEGGSSGSPLLNNSGQVIGQLHGGGASCSTPNEMDYYGRFDLAYDAKLKLWLGGGNSQQPDFVVTSIILNPAAPTANSTFSATVSVKNQGTAAGDGKYLDVWTHQTSNQSCEADGNQYQSVGTLAAGASKSFTFAGLSAGTAGSKTFRAFVDSACLTVESDDSNNQATKTYTVGSASASLSKGKYANYNFQIQSGFCYTVNLDVIAGDCNLYGQYQTYPTIGKYQYRSSNNGSNDESFSFTANITGTYYLSVYANSACTFKIPTYTVSKCTIPDYYPNYWNNNSTIRLKNNCYNYANNKRTDTIAQPGLKAGITLNFPYSSGNFTCSVVKSAAIADGLSLPLSTGNCQTGSDKVALIAGKKDYHWYRLDSNGWWSHKPGLTPATNRDNYNHYINNPQTAAWGPIYSVFCGYLCTCSSSSQGNGYATIKKTSKNSEYQGEDNEDVANTIDNFDLENDVATTNKTIKEHTFTVTIDVFSGRPNPRFTITSRKMSSDLSQLFAVSKVDDMFSKSDFGNSALGYRGVVVENNFGLVPTMPEKFKVYRGKIEIDGSNGVKSYRSDKNDAIEKYLLQIALEKGIIDQELFYIISGSVKK